MDCCHGITQGHLGIFDDVVGSAEWWASSWRRHDEGGVEARMSMAWCLWHIICVRRHLGVCGLLSLGVVVLYG